MLARVGADEFAILLDAALVGQAQALAQALLSSLARPFRLENSPISISGCAGIALCTSPKTIAAELLRDARVAMFHARQGGRNQCEVFDPQLRQRAHARLAMAVDLYQALERNQMAGVLPVQSESAQRSGDWLRGAAALAPPAIRPDPAVGFHSHRGKHRLDRSHGSLDSAPGRRATENLAGQVPGRSAAVDERQCVGQTTQGFSNRRRRRKQFSTKPEFRRRVCIWKLPKAR